MKRTDSNALRSAVLFISAAMEVNLAASNVLYFIAFYFKSTPRHMYQMYFSCDSTSWPPNLKIHNVAVPVRKERVSGSAEPRPRLYTEGAKEIKLYVTCAEDAKEARDEAWFIA
jgi:hypothetical protein